MSDPVVVTTVHDLRGALAGIRHDGGTVGFVPTMGYLHEGHVSLVERAATDCDVAVVSVFVNPLQFAPDEDLASYPRDFVRDLESCARGGAAVVFHPSVEEMYPRPLATTVSLGALSRDFEGASRPTHFAGVATVVAKLFGAVGACRAYFGEKDYQQLTIVRRMAADLSMPVEVIGCPTVRESDGLARSSRNVYLTPDERTAATVLHRALIAGRNLVLAGERDPKCVELVIADIVGAEKLAILDYAVAVDATDLERPSPLSGEVRLLVAAKVGRPRLIDNVGVTVPDADLCESGVGLAK